MKRSQRIALSVAVGSLAAAALPVYPRLREIRSYMTGNGGDRISHDWSLRSLFALPDLVRYEAPPLVLAMVALLFVVLTAVFTLVAQRLLRGKGELALATERRYVVRRESKCG